MLIFFSPFFWLLLLLLFWGGDAVRTASAASIPVERPAKVARATAGSVSPVLAQSKLAHLLDQPTKPSEEMIAASMLNYTLKVLPDGHADHTVVAYRNAIRRSVSWTGLDFSHPRKALKT